MYQFEPLTNIPLDYPNLGKALSHYPTATVKIMKSVLTNRGIPCKGSNLKKVRKQYVKKMQDLAKRSAKHSAKRSAKRSA